MPDDAAIAAFYESPKYFVEGDHGSGYEDYDRQTENVLPFFRGLLERLGPGNGRAVLDVGCAYGTHLALARDAGWQPQGVEVSGFARVMVAERHGTSIPVVASIVELPVRPWDLILLLDVVEHLRDPYQLFVDLIEKGAVVPETLVVVTTPNARSSTATHDPAGWEYRTPPEHLTYFSSRSLVFLLTTIGFKRVEASGTYRMSGTGVPSPATEESDGFMRPYAGLSCEAGDFAAREGAPGTWFRRERDRNRALALRFQSSPLLGGFLAAVTRQSDLRLREHDAELEAQRAAIQAEAAALESRTAEFEAFEQDRLYRLIRTLRGGESLTRKVRRSAWILGSMVLPARMKTLIRRLIGRGDPAVEGAVGSTAVKPYAVRAPAARLPGRRVVVHAIGNFMTGGSSRLVVDLIEHLSDEYHQEVIAGYVPRPPAYVGAPVREFRYLKSPKPLLAYLAKVRPDVLHVQFWGDVDLAWYRQVFEAGRIYGCPIVENVNTPIVPFVSASVSCYVYVSEYVRREFGKSLPDGLVINPGSNLDLFSVDSTTGPPDDCIGTVYRLEPDKLNERSIDAFIETVRLRPRTRVLIVGGGSLQAKFEQSVSSAGVASSFDFTGYVPYEDLPALYRRMSIFVAPVWQESFGQVSSFAMSMALPVVGYNVGALPEIVADDQLLAPPGDSEGLASIIADLLDNRDRRLAIGRKNHRRAHEKYSVGAMADQYRDVYRQLTGSK